MSAIFATKRERDAAVSRAEKAEAELAALKAATTAPAPAARPAFPADGTDAEQLAHIQDGIRNLEGSIARTAAAQAKLGHGQRALAVAGPKVMSRAAWSALKPAAQAEWFKNGGRLSD